MKSSGFRRPTSAFFTMVFAASLLLLFVAPSAQAAGPETIAAPFVGGPSAVTTQNTYNGIVTLKVSGSGMAAGTQCSDAFYIYAAASGTLGQCGAGTPPVPAAEFGLYINGKPAKDSMIGVPPQYSSTHSYQFSISLAARTKLTFGVGDLYVSDNWGQYTITVTQVLLGNQVQLASSPTDRAGYISTGTKGQLTDVQYTDVRGQWTVPSTRCASGENSEASAWVGLGGMPGSALEQIGTNTSCVKGVATYYAWYEMVPRGSVTCAAYPAPYPPGTAEPNGCPQLLNGFSVHPGDQVTAQVTYAGGGQYELQLRSNAGSASTLIVRGPGDEDQQARDAANWMVETRPIASGLTKFSTGLLPVVNFSNCKVNDRPITEAPSIYYFHVQLASHHVPDAFPGLITSGGTAFSVVRNPLPF